MAVAANDLMQVTYWSTLSAQTLMSVLHYRVDETPVAVADETFYWSLWALWFADTANVLPAAYVEAAPTNVLIDRVTVQRIRPTRGVYAEAAMGAAGEHAGVALTANICASITKRSTISGRTGVGHLQWPPLVATDYTNGVIDLDFKEGELANLALQILEPQVISTGTTEATLIPCLPAGGANNNYDLWQTGVRTQVRTMHRRTVGLGI